MQGEHNINVIYQYNKPYNFITINLMKRQQLLYLRTIAAVDACPVTISPDPMMVYALTLNVATVLGGRSLSVCCVADVLVQLNTPLLLVHTSYAMMTPFGSEGGVHETVTDILSEVADKPDTGPGTAWVHVIVYT